MLGAFLSRLSMLAELPTAYCHINALWTASGKSRYINQIVSYVFKSQTHTRGSSSILEVTVANEAEYVTGGARGWTIHGNNVRLLPTCPPFAHGPWC